MCSLVEGRSIHRNLLLHFRCKSLLFYLKCFLKYFPTEENHVPFCKGEFPIAVTY